jgi:transcriptional regulator with XRE-family HTH domain
MISMNAAQRQFEDTERKKALADYVRHLMGRRTLRAVADEAGISHGALSNLLSEKKIPRAETLQKLAGAIGAEEARLMLLAGYLDEIPSGYLHPRAATLAERITALNETVMLPVLEALEAQFNTLIRVMGGNANAQPERLSVSETIEALQSLTEDETMSKEEKAKRLNQLLNWFQKEYPEGYQEWEKDKARREEGKPAPSPKPPKRDHSAQPHIGG